MFQFCEISVLAVPYPSVHRWDEIWHVAPTGPETPKSTYK